MSSIRLPYGASFAPPWFRAWITVSKSHPKVTSWMPTSKVNVTALLHAIALTPSIVVGRGMRSVMAAIISLFLSQMIMPTPAKLELLNTAPSKFALKELELKGHHDCVEVVVELLEAWISCASR